MLGIHGLQPARFKSQEEQLDLCKISLNRYQEDLNKYLYLIDLQVPYKEFTFLFQTLKSFEAIILFFPRFRIEMNVFFSAFSQKISKL